MATGYSRELGFRICRMLSRKEKAAEVAESVGVSWRTITRWAKRTDSPEFVEFGSMFKAARTGEPPSSESEVKEGNAPSPPIDPRSNLYPWREGDQRGRRSELNDAKATAIIDALSAGYSPTAAARRGGVTRKTFDRWVSIGKAPDACDMHAGFAEGVDLALASALESDEAVLIKLARENGDRVAVMELLKRRDEYWADPADRIEVVSSKQLTDEEVVNLTRRHQEKDEEDEEKGVTYI